MKSRKKNNIINWFSCYLTFIKLLQYAGHTVAQKGSVLVEVESIPDKCSLECNQRLFHTEQKT